MVIAEFCSLVRLRVPIARVVPFLLSPPSCGHRTLASRCTGALRAISDALLTTEKEVKGGEDVVLQN